MKSGFFKMTSTYFPTVWYVCAGTSFNNMAPCCHSRFMVEIQQVQESHCTASTILYNVNKRRKEKLHGWDQMDYLKDLNFEETLLLAL